MSRRVPTAVALKEAPGLGLLHRHRWQPDPEGGSLQTMAICRSQEAAERFVSGDPFVRNGQVLSHRIRVWANMFAR